MSATEDVIARMMKQPGYIGALDATVAHLRAQDQEISDLREQLRICRENVKFLQMAVFEEEGNLVQATAETNEPRCDHHTKEQA